MTATNSIPAVAGSIVVVGASTSTQEEIRSRIVASLDPGNTPVIVFVSEFATCPDAKDVQQLLVIEAFEQPTLAEMPFLKKTGKERSQPNQPWYARFQKRDRRRK